MAAYAAVVSLMNNLEQIGNHPRLSSCFDDNQIQSLRLNLAFLLEFLEGVGIARRKVKGLERRIASAAHAAEDVIESRVVDLLHAGFQENVPIFSMDLQMIMQGMSLIQEEVAKVGEERPYQVQQPTPPSRAGRVSSERNLMVGFNEVHLQLLDRLTGYTRDRDIIPIVGMGGSGKTTLAKKCYLTKEHFDVRAWASVSQDYNVRGLLLELLSCLIGSTNKVVESTVDELGERLHKHLTGRRYLIILDDMWSVECWDQIKYFLPDNNNQSRIIITTRLMNLASQFSYSLVMNLLDHYSSWNLLCHNVFGHKDCPLELEPIGKQIVEYCMGLPLAITLVGALLRESSMTREYWEHVAQNIRSGLKDDELHAILMLSYNALPAYLKPCFLYLGIFPADQEFSVSRIIKLWVGEGFLKPHVGRTLEDVAEGYMNELIDRSLIVVSTRGLNGKPKNCKLLDLVRELCLSIVYEEKFLSFVKTRRTPADVNNERRYSAFDSIADEHKDPQFFHAMESSLLARTLICESPALLSFKSRLLRVVTEVYSDSLETTLQQVNLRFLAFESICTPIGWIRTYELPSSISLLWNVQTLVMDGNIEEVVAPSEIWEMPQLRNLCFNRIRLPEPPASDDDDLVVLRNLQTLRTALDFNCSEEVCKRMPNIRKLGIFYDDFSGEGQNNSWYCIDHVGYFAELESLSCCFRRVPDRDDLVQNLKFPCSLRKLILQDCELHWDDMSVIGSLPLLQVLKLKCQSVRGAKWETVEGEFPSLRILEIDSCYLIYWFSESSHFPRLEKLVLRRLYRLNEIPSEIGDLPILGNISVFECSISAAISAARILKEVEEQFGECVIRVGFRKEKEVAEFRAKLELEGLTSSGLQIDEL